MNRNLPTLLDNVLSKQMQILSAGIDFNWKFDLKNKIDRFNYDCVATPSYQNCQQKM